MRLSGVSYGDSIAPQGVQQQHVAEDGGQGAASTVQCASLPFFEG